MIDGWKKRATAMEEEYFTIKENQALERLSKRNDQKKERLSPITGKPMVQKVYQGVVIDQCPDTKGIWLDAGELGQILEILTDRKSDMVEKFFTAVLDNKE